MSASKQKGTKFETEVVNFLRANGFENVERRALQGTQDLGDIMGVEGWTIQCKNQNKLLLAEWMDQTECQRELDRENPFGLLVIRRRMKPVSQAYAVLPLGQMIDPMLKLG